MRGTSSIGGWRGRKKGWGRMWGEAGSICGKNCGAGGVHKGLGGIWKGLVRSGGFAGSVGGLGEEPGAIFSPPSPNSVPKPTLPIPLTSPSSDTYFLDF